VIDADITITQNWDNTCNLAIYGKVVLERKSRGECEEKRNFLLAGLIIKALRAENPVDSTPEV
jgi:hypothetical protein